MSGGISVAAGTKALGVLGAVTGAGSSAVIDLQRVHPTTVMQTSTTGSPTTVSATLQGSLDGVNFVTLATSSSTAGDLQVSVDKPVQFLKVVLATLSGGTTPTFSATIAASG